MGQARCHNWVIREEGAEPVFGSANGLQSDGRGGWGVAGLARGCVGLTEPGNAGVVGGNA